MTASLAATIIAARGWRRRLIAFCAGALGALALAPFDIIPTMFVPMTCAVWLIDGAGVGRAKKGARTQGLRTRLKPCASAFGAGWWWGFGYFVAGLWWLGAAFLVEAEEFAWALPLGVLGLPAYLAVFPGLGFAFARLIWSPGAGRLFALAAGLGLSEWLRGHVLTGFPWNNFGMAFGGTLVTAQLASLVGLYGLTVVSTLIFASPAVIADSQARAPGSARRRWAPLGAAALALAAIVGFGLLRLAEPDPGFVPGVRLRIIQPNLAQDEKFRPERKAAILAHYLALSARPADLAAARDEVTAYIWPESAFPFILSRDGWALDKIGAFLGPDDILYTGAARAEDREPDADAAGDPLAAGSASATFYNAVQVLATDGLILDSYDKVHLVPFGEYLPLRTFLTRFGLHHFVHVPGGFEAGAARAALNAPGLPKAAPLICYEAIFPGEVMPTADPGRPGFFLNVTNDGWFGRTPGPYQHFSQARLRAIEEGLPMARAANTGVSAIIDAYGRVLAKLPLGEEGVVEGALPRKIAPPLYARFPRAIPFLIWAFALAAALVARPPSDND